MPEILRKGEDSKHEDLFPILPEGNMIPVSSWGGPRPSKQAKPRGKVKIPWPHKRNVNIIKMWTGQEKVTSIELLAEFLPSRKNNVVGMA